MREYVFTVEYAAGAHPTADVFREHPDLVAQSVDCGATTDRFWRVEHVSGPEPALGALVDATLTPAVPAEVVSGRDREIDSHHEVIDRCTDRLTLYSRLEGIEGTDAVPALVTKYLDGHAVFETTRRDGEYRWRVLLENDRQIGLLYDTLTGRSREELSVTFERMGDAQGWAPDALTVASMPAEQREAIRLAVAEGYYEEPREVELQELAEATGVPRSTLSYRLRRAESTLARRFVGQLPDRSSDSCRLQPAMGR